MKPHRGWFRRNWGEWCVILRRGSGKSAVTIELRVAELVAMAWVGPKPDGHVLAFRDRDRSNIDIENLFWLPREQVNAYHHVRGDQVGTAKLKAEDVIAIRREVHEAVLAGRELKYKDFAAIGKRYGCTGMNILQIAQCKIWQHVNAGVPPFPVKAISRFKKGVKPTSSRKLSEDDAVRIKQRLARGETPADIHPDYADKVGIMAIRLIASGKNWVHVKV